MISPRQLSPGSPARSRCGANTEQSLVDRINENPTVLGLGDLDLKRASWRSRQISLLLESPAESVLFVVELQLGPTDDRHIMRVMERWLTERKRQRLSRCFAVLVGEEIAPRYVNILKLISRAVPLLALKMEPSEGSEGTSLRFRHVGLR
jgi:hypothetical protein